MLLEVFQVLWLPWNKSAFVRIICQLRCCSLCFICKLKLRWLCSYYSKYCRFCSIIFVHFFYQLKFKNRLIDVFTSFNFKYKFKHFAICFKESSTHFLWFGCQKKLFIQALGFHHYTASISSPEKFWVEAVFKLA